MSLRHPNLVERDFAAVMADELAPVGELVAVDGDELAGLGPRELEAFGGLGDTKAGRQTLETGFGGHLDGFLFKRIGFYV